MPQTVVFVAERAIQLKSALTSSLPLRVKLTTVAATVTSFSAEKKKTTSSVMHQARFPTSLVNSLVSGIVMHLVGRWGIYSGSLRQWSIVPHV